MQLADLLTEHNAILFILLFSRITGVMATFPFFSHMAIPVSLKTALAFYLTILFFPDAQMLSQPQSGTMLLLMVLTEMMIGLIAGVALQLIFAALGIAGMQISMVMGFSMASVVDPMTGVNTPIVAQFLTLIAVLTLLAFNGHHLMLLFLSESLSHIRLGAFYPTHGMEAYLISGFAHMFMMGFILSFPIIALSILSDVIFGMLMKTMPQFNLLVVGFPIKIFLSIVVLSVVLGSMMAIFKREFMHLMAFLQHFW